MAGQRELVEQLFEAALALEPTEREAFFDQVCGDDPELRRMVEDLLAEDARAGSFLRHPPFDLLGKTAGSFHPVAEDTHPANGNGTPPVTAPAGRLNPGQTLIDRFLVVRFIAKGGMGE